MRRTSQDPPDSYRFSSMRPSGVRPHRLDPLMFLRLENLGRKEKGRLSFWLEGIHKRKLSLSECLFMPRWGKHRCCVWNGFGWIKMLISLWRSHTGFKDLTKHVNMFKPTSSLSSAQPENDSHTNTRKDVSEERRALVLGEGADGCPCRDARLHSWKVPFTHLLMGVPSHTTPPYTHTQTHTHWNKVMWLHQLSFLACCVLAQLDFTINFWTFHSQLNLLLLCKKVLESISVWIFLEIRVDVVMYQIVSIVLGCQTLTLKANSWY